MGKGTFCLFGFACGGIQRRFAAGKLLGQGIQCPALADGGEQTVWQEHLDAGRRQLEQLNARYAEAKNADVYKRQPRTRYSITERHDKIPCFLRNGEKQGIFWVILALPLAAKSC